MISQQLRELFADLPQTGAKVYVSFANTGGEIYRFVDADLGKAVSRWDPWKLGGVLFYECTVGGENGRFVSPEELKRYLEGKVGE